MSKIVRKDTDSDGVEVNIMYAFGLLLRRLWLLILVALVVGASCAVITKAVEEPTYTLSMTFIVNNKLKPNKRIAQEKNGKKGSSGEPIFQNKDAQSSKIYSFLCSGLR